MGWPCMSTYLQASMLILLELHMWPAEHRWPHMLGSAWGRRWGLGDGTWQPTQGTLRPCCWLTHARESQTKYVDDDLMTTRLSSQAVGNRSGMRLLVGSMVCYARTAAAHHYCCSYCKSVISWLQATMIGLHRDAYKNHYCLQ